ncbi:HBR123Wp [Eremothecium sinecaudum]|uniref:HBR123Wp n=1 Tax=Eremothecium sinecaudum TaxID=45286 RepID=A0A120K151_9SACH|nr:HBR123Wp [Eremothecium sinecaudum]AMD19024.1 HBR123Wp [Eremothecium sinecaudum]
MSNILYNANSKLVSKYQKKLQQVSVIHEVAHEDEPFKCKHPKDSRLYLIELCCHVYPVQLYSTIQDLPDWQLSVHALLALLLKNFVISWYGTKIPSKDNEFVVLLFNVVESAIKHLTNHKVNCVQLLYNDLPYILDMHCTIMSRVIDEDLSYDQFLQLYLDDHQYPSNIIIKLMTLVENDSELQKAFLEGLLGDLLLDKIVGKAVAPYLVIKGITSMCDKLLHVDLSNTAKEAGETNSWISRAEHMLRRSSHFISYLTSAFSLKGRKTTMKGVLCAHLYLFTFLKNITKLQGRKPALYSSMKLLQSLVDRWKPLNHMLSNLIGNVLEQKVLRRDNVHDICNSLRHALFPNDNKMGEQKPEPSPEELVQLKLQCINSMWEVCQRYRLEGILAIKKTDMQVFVDGICKDVKMNQFLIYRILSYLLTQLV